MRSTVYCLVAAALLLPGGCLTNLNEQKYFERLEAGSPTQHERVVQHRELIEGQLREALRADVKRTVVHVPLWGETWDTVRRVTDGQQLFMRGRITHVAGPASPYYIRFTVGPDGEVTIGALQVYEFGGGPAASVEPDGGKS